MSKIRILELCAGYGSQKLALDNLGFDVYSEIAEFDKYASKAYMQLHGETKNYGDIYTIDEKKLPHFDMITYSTPCQDFSVAGKQLGGDKGSGTRSSLLWECERIIKAVKPKYLLMENVKNLVGKKHKHNFIKWLNVLEGLGYQNFYKVLNAKDFGIPQNRERVFCVSILGGDQYLFPNPIPLKKRLKDILEQNVDEKYYLSDKMVENLFKERDGLNYKPAINKDIAVTLTTKTGQRNSDNYIQEPLAYDEQNGYVRQDGCVGTLTTDGSSPKHNNRVIEPLYIKEATAKGYAEAYGYDSVTLDQPNSKTRRGRVGKQLSNTLTCSCNMGVVEPFIADDTQGFDGIRRYDNYSPTLRSERSGLKVVEPKIIKVERTPLKFLDRNGKKTDGDYSFCIDTAQTGGIKEIYPNGYCIRRLTPRECFRLMGVKDEQYNKLHNISNTQLYKMAGNSIVVDVLMAIFNNLFLSDKGTKGQLTLF